MAIKDATAPQNFTQLNHFPHFLDNIAMVVEPLKRLLRKDSKWNQEEAE